MKKHLHLALILLILVFNALNIFAQDAEFTGQFDSLVANTEETERVIFTLARGIKSEKPFGENIHLTEGRLLNPQNGKSILALLAEEEDGKPNFFVDLNGDNTYQESEKFVMKREEPKNPYLWITTINLPIQDKIFSNCPIFIRYFRSVKTDKMTKDDRLFQQTTEVFARGKVNVNGKPLLVQYSYDFEVSKIDPQLGWLGVDADDDGEIYMDNLSPEAAMAKRETVIFRIGQTYISTKKADLNKNQIVLKTHKADEYKRIELAVGNNLPTFQFTDLYGKKRNFDEFKGKYVLVDIWGFWCKPCLEELPYLREAYKRFQGRNFEIVGLNTDEDFTTESIRTNLEKSDLKWTQAEFNSIVPFLKKMRISSYPTTFLISPEGKILSMGRTDKNELDLRGKDLFDTLNEILPEK